MSQLGAPKYHYCDRVANKAYHDNEHYVIGIQKLGYCGKNCLRALLNMLSRTVRVVQKCGQIIS
ncbi:hypothetical protein BpHYR1_034286 [Brachionus plicatilis]|uniref:Uncharacterized protein n=1 Tax=Brachionus plicatilis TaxID=10195 RepID=A0A3M7RVH6_BRAPC|nr:hypothetical protein BpHYR1_034286 [Brachionus plicatilis]